MAYVITDACIKDFICATECSTAAIAPMEGDAAAGTVSQLFINPDVCIDCGSCISSCEHGAIFSIDDLPADKAQFTAKNKAYFN